MLLWWMMMCCLLGKIFCNQGVCRHGEKGTADHGRPIEAKVEPVSQLFIFIFIQQFRHCTYIQLYSIFHLHSICRFGWKKQYVEKPKAGIFCWNRLIDNRTALLYFIVCRFISYFFTLFHASSHLFYSIAGFNSSSHVFLSFFSPSYLCFLLNVIVAICCRERNWLIDNGVCENRARPKNNRSAS